MISRMSRKVREDTRLHAAVVPTTFTLEVHCKQLRPVVGTMDSVIHRIVSFFNCRRKA